MSIERKKDERGYNYMVRFPSEIVLEGSTSPVKTVWFNTKYGETPSDAADAAWTWFQDVLVMAAKDLRAPELTGFPDGFGPLMRYSDGKYYHGRQHEGQYQLTVLKKPFNDGTGRHTYQIRDWDPRSCTAVAAGRFCGNCSQFDRVQDNEVYICHGHDILGPAAAEARGSGYTNGE